jgi:hypothetical protein
MKPNQLEGIASTEPLHTLLQKAIDMIPTLPPQLLVGVVDHHKKDDEKKMKEDFDKHMEKIDQSINALLDQMIACSRTTHLPSIEQAVSILKQQQIAQDRNQEPQSLYISIPVLRAMKTLFDYCDMVNGNKLLTIELDRALELHPTRLIYTKSLPNEDSDEVGDDQNMDEIIKNNPHLSKEQKKFQLRMRQLRLQNEERKYMKITQNVHTFKVNDDTITTKSMTYAASIGLNMIVAPITFGVFMYFFAGSLLDYFWPLSSSSAKGLHPSVTSTTQTVDVKKVIAGVVSGVMMLFIEMILFVIRTHEMDKAMLQKRKKQGHITSLSPFGYYKSTTTKTYVDH